MSNIDRFYSFQEIFNMKMLLLSLMALILFTSCQNERVKELEYELSEAQERIEELENKISEARSAVDDAKSYINNAQYNIQQTRHFGNLLSLRAVENELDDAESTLEDIDLDY